jgi:hypothetical protein
MTSLPPVFRPLRPTTTSIRARSKRISRFRSAIGHDARRLRTVPKAENTNSRVYVGIHFRSAIEAGDRLGRRIGRFAFTHTLQPLRKQRER